MQPLMFLRLNATFLKIGVAFRNKFEIIQSILKKFKNSIVKASLICYN